MGLVVIAVPRIEGALLASQSATTGAGTGDHPWPATDQNAS